MEDRNGAKGWPHCVEGNLDQIRFYDAYHRQHSLHKVTQMLHMEKRTVIRNLLSQVEAPEARALVVGCGSGEDTEVVSPPVVAIDLSTIALGKARQKYPKHMYLAADAHRLPFASDSFDIIICSEVIEHVQNPSRMLAEFQAVLKEGGVLLITTPNWLSLYGLARYLGELFLRRQVTSGGQPIDHWYTKGFLQKQLSRLFEIREWRGIWFFPPVGLGHKTLPLSLMVPLFRLLLPIERFLQSRVSGYAHLLAVSCIMRKSHL